jgi:endonuclease/exonuclease/phosphatase family metal-dependent hydrolase
MRWRYSLILFLAPVLSCSMPWNTPYRQYGGSPPADVALLSCRDTTLVRWIDSENESDRRVLGWWCATVGAPLVADYRRTSPEAPMDSLVMVSWNVHVGGGDVVRVVEALESGEFTGAPVEDYVLMLQEVHRTGSVPLRDESFIPARIEEYPPGGERLDVDALARRLGLWVCYVPSMRNGPPGSGDTEEDRGSAILATRRLDDLAAIVLPYERNRRVAVAGTLSGRTGAGDAWTLRAVNTHLSNRSRFIGNLGTTGMVGRLRQARALCAAVDETPALLAGDFNTWAPSAFERSLPLIREQFPLPERLDDNPTVRVGFAPDRRIDYFFFRLGPGQRARYRRLDSAFGSDHFPLLAVVRFDAG